MLFFDADESFLAKDARLVLFPRRQHDMTASHSSIFPCAAYHLSLTWRAFLVACSTLMTGMSIHTYVCGGQGLQRNSHVAETMSATPFVFTNQSGIAEARRPRACCQGAERRRSSFRDY